MALPQFLVIGHIVKDITVGGWRPGGGVAYAARQALELGLRVAAVTRCGPDLDPEALVPGVDWRVSRSNVTTTFENHYGPRGREQRLPALAPPIRLADVPEEWREAPIILFAPVFHDVDPALPQQIGGAAALVGIGAQGWLRRCEAGRVLPGEIEAGPAWLHGDVVFVSEEDAVNPEEAEVWQQSVPCVVLTRAGRGCTVWDASGGHEITALPSTEVDPTGAGDVFAAAFLVAMSEGGDAVEAARFGAAAAALAVEGAGLEAVAGRRAIERLNEHRAVAPS